jgi:hypothetical protein
MVEVLSNTSKVREEKRKEKEKQREGCSAPPHLNGCSPLHANAGWASVPLQLQTNTKKAPHKAKKDHGATGEVY